MNPGLRCFIVGVCLAAAQSNPYQSDDECRDRATKYLFNNLCCSKCKPGTRKLSDCTEEKDTGCGVCPDGTYSDSMNYYAKCFSCTKCQEDKGLEYTKRCSEDSDAVCVCKPGWYCVFNDDPCSSCERHRVCLPGHGAVTPGTSTQNVRCGKCPVGTFSNESSARPCWPHTRCELQGRTLLIPGTGTADAVCGPVLSTIPNRVTTMVITSRGAPAPTQPSTKPPVLFSRQTSPISSTVSWTHPQDHTTLVLWIGLPVAVLLVVLLTAVFCICHRKALLKPAVYDGVEAKACMKPEHLCGRPENHVLLADSSSDPSTSLSSDGQGTGRSQDCLHVEQQSVSSPVVNLSVTTTINYQVNPTTGCCTIPISPYVQPPEPEFPLSQEEELHVSCEQEDTKDAIQSVQESGMTKC